MVLQQQTETLTLIREPTVLIISTVLGGFTTATTPVSHAHMLVLRREPVNVLQCLGTQ